MTLRDRHLFILAQHVQASLYTWLLPADLGINYGYCRGGKWEKTCTSVEEILCLIDYPRPEEDEDFSEEAREYARGLWRDLGDFIRERLTLSVRPE